MTQISDAWIKEANVQKLCDLFDRAGYQIYFVGGCVRNALMGLDISDIDLSTNARPEQMIELAESAGIRALPTGIDHGTITMVVDHEPFEITCFRKDVETDGRRAVVAFSDDIADDARRRDLTINALYADATGHVIDPLGGLSDIAARRIRFIDDADQRIREDYLRILRFFRFYAWYGDPAQGLDADGLAASAANLAGLETLAKERIGAEMIKILAAPNPAPTIAAMAQSGVLNAILPGADPRYLAPLVHFETEIDAGVCAMRRLTVLGGAEPAENLRLSNNHRKLIEDLRDEIGSGRGPGVLGYELGVKPATSVLLLRAAMFEHPVSVDDLSAIDTGAAAKFPITADDLMPGYQGPALGKKLRQLEASWIASNFTLDRDSLLQ